MVGGIKMELSLYIKSRLYLYSHPTPADILATSQNQTSIVINKSNIMSDPRLTSSNYFHLTSKLKNIELSTSVHPFNSNFGILNPQSHSNHKIQTRFEI